MLGVIPCYLTGVSPPPISVDQLIEIHMRNLHRSLLYAMYCTSASLPLRCRALYFLQLKTHTHNFFLEKKKTRRRRRRRRRRRTTTTTPTTAAAAADEPPPRAAARLSLSPTLCSIYPPGLHICAGPEWINRPLDQGDDSHAHSRLRISRSATRLNRSTR